MHAKKVVKLLKNKGKTRVLFVCLGNICRSPTAHGVFRQLVEERGLSHLIETDSAGTGAYHVGEPPDHRATAEAAKRGYDLSDLRARQAVAADFAYYDYVIAMDVQNLGGLRSICPTDYSGYLGMMTDFTDSYEGDVPDPYFGGAAGFTYVLDMLEDACGALLDRIVARGVSG